MSQKVPSAAVVLGASRVNLQDSIWALTRENLSSGVCKQQGHRPSCPNAQSDQHLCYPLIEKYRIDLLQVKFQFSS